MKIDWLPLALVAVTTTVAAIAIVGIFSIGVLALTSSIGTHPAGPTTDRLAPRLIGYGCLTVAGLFALYGLYLIIPQFH